MKIWSSDHDAAWHHQSCDMIQARRADGNWKGKCKSGSLPGFASALAENSLLRHPTADTSLEAKQGHCLTELRKPQ